MYNSIYPVNINYRKHNEYRNFNGSTSAEQEKITQENDKKPNTFPNGTKVAIDYTKGQINISQVITDFRSTILAINAPKDVSEEVNIYLNLVEKESLKENPSKDIILSNLKNASKISDTYITKSLNKPSNVVEGWIDALFLQKINLKSDPNEINPDFLLEFPKKTQEKINDAKVPKDNIEKNDTESTEVTFKDENIKQNQFLSISSPANFKTETKQEPPAKEEIAIKNSEFSEVYSPQNNNEEIESESSFELSQENKEKKENPSLALYNPINESDKAARELFIKAKQEPDTNKGDINAINMLNEALGLLSNNDNSNENIKAAIHFERGKIFDNYDYVDYALRDYWEASKTEDFNLKAQAFYKSAKIYDEFKDFTPALDNYLSCVAYSGEIGNSGIQTIALNDIASLYAGQFDFDNTSQYSSLAIESAQNSNDKSLIAKTYSTTAQNYQYLGENEKALDGYKNALATFSKTNESYEQMAYNYEQAALVMEKLGNKAKANKLQLKANLYYQKAQQQQDRLAEAS